MKWIVFILIAAGIWWAYNNLNFSQIGDNAVSGFKSKSLVNTVNQTRENRQNAVDSVIDN